MKLLQRIFGRERGKATEARAPELEDNTRLGVAKRLINEGYREFGYTSIIEEAIGLAEYIERSHPDCVKTAEELAGIAASESDASINIGSLAFTGETAYASEEQINDFCRRMRESAAKEGASCVSRALRKNDNFYYDFLGRLAPLYAQLSEKDIFANFYKEKIRRENEMIEKMAESRRKIK